MSLKRILVISGPNLNLLGKREPEIYGGLSLENIYLNMQNMIDETKYQLVCKQSNSETEIIDWIQDAYDRYNAIIINAGGYTHSSVSIRDALKHFDGFKIEIHLSNIHSREEFRKKSLLSAVSSGIIAGFGDKSYYLALKAIELNLNEG